MFITKSFVTYYKVIYNSIQKYVMFITNSFVTYYKVICNSLQKFVMFTTKSSITHYKSLLCLLQSHLLLITKATDHHSIQLGEHLQSAIIYSLSMLKQVSRYISQVEIFILVGPCQKRDIVDTFSHASRATCYNMYKQTDFPTI